jgi:hypothetical protein
MQITDADHGRSSRMQVIKKTETKRPPGVCAFIRDPAGILLLDNAALLKTNMI